MSGNLKEFEKWKSKNKYNLCSGPFQRGIREGWRAALEWVSNQCPTNEKTSFANQGQGMDGYTELANYKAMYKKLKEELDGHAGRK